MTETCGYSFASFKCLISLHLRSVSVYFCIFVFLSQGVSPTTKNWLGDLFSCSIITTYIKNI